MKKALAVQVLSKKITCINTKRKESGRIHQDGKRGGKGEIQRHGNMTKRGKVSLYRGRRMKDQKITRGRITSLDIERIH